MNYIFDTKFKKICYSFLFPETHRYFGNYVVPTAETADIFTSKEEIVLNPYGFKHNDLNPFSEYQHLMVKTGNYLLGHKSCMFHGSLVKWKEKAILFTGPSGVGKTTQYRLWSRLYDVKMINGDKPILHYDGHHIIGYSSPWNGKEQYGTAGESAPLQAIILLEQSDTNKIELFTALDAVVPLFKQFIAYPDSTAIIKQESVFLDTMLEKVPVFKLMNKGDMESAILTLHTLETNYDL